MKFLVCHLMKDCLDCLDFTHPVLDCDSLILLVVIPFGSAIYLLK